MSILPMHVCLYVEIWKNTAYCLLFYRRCRAPFLVLEVMMYSIEGFEKRSRLKSIY